jgi:hypothetical protein
VAEEGRERPEEELWKMNERAHRKRVGKDNLHGWLERVMNLGENRIGMRITRSA